MNFSNKYIIEICQAVATSAFICSLHLNDNGISWGGLDGRADLKEEVMDIFGARTEPNKAGPQTKVINKDVVDGKRLENIIMNELNIIDRVRFKEKPTKFNVTDYTNYYVRERISKSIRDRSLRDKENHAFSGATPHTTPEVDNFCMHRKFNFPELIFNQDPSKDSYFEVNQNEKWTYQSEIESTHCYICQKQCYAMIFYERYDEL